MGVASESRILTFGMTKLDNGGSFPRYYFGCWDDKTQKMEANLSLSSLLWACLLCSEPVFGGASESRILVLEIKSKIRQSGALPKVVFWLLGWQNWKIEAASQDIILAVGMTKSENRGRFRKLYFGSWDKKQNPTIGVASESRILTFGMTKLENGGRFPKHYFSCWDDKKQKMEANHGLISLKNVHSWFQQLISIPRTCVHVYMCSCTYNVHVYTCTCAAVHVMCKYLPFLKVFCKNLQKSHVQRDMSF